MIAPYVYAVQQVLAQDTEQENKARLQTVRASPKTVESRSKTPRCGHGHKSKRFNGNKQHVATGLDTALLLRAA